MEESSSNVEGQKSWSQKKSRKSFLFVLVQLCAAKGREVFDEIAVSPFRLFQTARPLAQVEGVKKEQDSNDGCDTPNLATKRCCAYFNDFKWIYIYMRIWYISMIYIYIYVGNSKGTYSLCSWKLVEHSSALPYLPWSLKLHWLRKDEPKPMVTDAPEAAPEGTAAGNGEAPTEAPKDNVVNLTWPPRYHCPGVRSLVSNKWWWATVLLSAFIPMYKNGMKEGFINLNCTIGWYNNWCNPSAYCTCESCNCSRVNLM